MKALCYGMLGLAWAVRSVAANPYIWINLSIKVAVNPVDGSFPGGPRWRRSSASSTRPSRVRTVSRRGPSADTATAARVKSRPSAPRRFQRAGK